MSTSPRINRHEYIRTERINRPSLIRRSPLEEIANNIAIGFITFFAKLLILPVTIFEFSVRLVEFPLLVLEKFFFRLGFPFSIVGFYFYLIRSLFILIRFPCTVIRKGVDISLSHSNDQARVRS